MVSDDIIYTGSISEGGYRETYRDAHYELLLEVDRLGAEIQRLENLIRVDILTAIKDCEDLGAPASTCVEYIELITRKAV